MVRKLEVKSNLEKIIDKGSYVAADRMKRGNKYYILNLRIHNELNEMIDDALTERIGLSKTAWILEAIQDKLKKNNERT